MTKIKPKRSFGPLVIASLIYVVGIITTVSWSNNSLQKLLIKQADQTLSNALASTREIITAETSNSGQALDLIDSPRHAACEKQLTRLATQGKFDLLGAQTLKNNTNKILVSQHNKKRSSEIEAAISMQGMLNTKPIHFDTIKHSILGNIRIAIQKDENLKLIAAKQITGPNAPIHVLYIRHILSAILLMVLPIPMVILSQRTERKFSKKIASLNRQLQKEIEQQKLREHELKDAITDLERFNSVSAGRESRIIELKAEVNELLDQQEAPKRYNVDLTD